MEEETYCTGREEEEENEIEEGMESKLSNFSLVEEMIDIHILVIPPLSWRRDLRFAYSVACVESVSVGFVRVLPQSMLKEIRQYISQQLDSRLLPSEFILLRKLGHYLTWVNEKQENILPIKLFAPPLSMQPELYILDSRCFIDNTTTFHDQSSDLSLLNPAGVFLPPVGDIHYENEAARNINFRNDIAADHERTAGQTSFNRHQPINEMNNVPILLNTDTYPAVQKPNKRSFHKFKDMPQRFRPVQGVHDFNNKTGLFPMKQDHYSSTTPAEMEIGPLVQPIPFTQATPIPPRTINDLPLHQSLTLQNRRAPAQPNGNASLMHHNNLLTRRNENPYAYEVPTRPPINSSVMETPSNTNSYVISGAGATLRPSSNFKSIPLVHHDHVNNTDIQTVPINYPIQNDNISAYNDPFSLPSNPPSLGNTYNDPSSFPSNSQSLGITSAYNGTSMNKSHTALSNDNNFASAPNGNDFSSTNYNTLNIAPSSNGITSMIPPTAHNGRHFNETTAHGTSLHENSLTRTNNEALMGNPMEPNNSYTSADGLDSMHKSVSGSQIVSRRAEIQFNTASDNQNGASVNHQLQSHRYGELMKPPDSTKNTKVHQSATGTRRRLSEEPDHNDVTRTLKVDDINDPYVAAVTKELQEQLVFSSDDPGVNVNTGLDRSKTNNGQSQKSFPGKIVATNDFPEGVNEKLLSQEVTSNDEPANNKIGGESYESLLTAAEETNVRSIDGEKNLKGRGKFESSLKKDVSTSLHKSTKEIKNAAVKGKNYLDEVIKVAKRNNNNMAINQIRQIGLEKDSMALISAGSQQNLATRDDITPKVKAQLLPKNENGLADHVWKRRYYLERQRGEGIKKDLAITKKAMDEIVKSIARNKSDHNGIRFSRNQQSIINNLRIQCHRLKRSIADLTEQLRITREKLKIEKRANLLAATLRKQLRQELIDKQIQLSLEYKFLHETAKNLF